MIERISDLTSELVMLSHESSHQELSLTRAELEAMFICTNDKPHN